MARSSQALTLPGPPEALAAELLRWYAEQKRELPWRGLADPYAIWVSEVMLQQTQAAVVGPYFDRFLRRFPTVQSLAQAAMADVLGLWSGLGYYARARTLHRAAQVIAETGFPSSHEGLRTLPGFGPYTAAAVGAIAFGFPEPAIDGNAVRVYARLCGLKAPRLTAEPLLREVARPLMTTAAGTPGDLNQAIMDLGQRVCTVRSPHCLLCPWRERCRALAEGTVAEIPVRTKAKPRKQLRVLAAVARKGGALLLARRRESGLFGGLWELPSVDSHAPAELAAALKRELGLTATIGAPLGTTERVLTHRELTLTGHAAKLRGRLVPRADGVYLEARWVEASELRQLGLSTATRQLLAVLEGAAAPAPKPATKPRPRRAL